MSVYQVGIIGGGQLALMLTDAACRMGLRPLVLAEDSTSPVGQIYSNVVFGSAHDPEALELLFNQASHIIFENEFVNCDLLEKISDGKEVRFFPGLDVISQFQDKLEQKRILNQLEIPTADFFVLNFDEDLKIQLSKILKEFGGSCVLKWSRMGYDGKGVLIIDGTPESFQRTEAFVREAQKKKSSVYAERKISFKRELAMVSVFSIQGEFLSYPLVVSEQKNGICFQVTGPATQLGVSLDQESLVQVYMRKIAQSSKLKGVFAMELFETLSGELIVNEIAPRVHNSGHYTQNACVTDQFENHWRAVLGMPLGRVDARSCFAMLNLLGPNVPELAHSQVLLPEPSSRVHLHWYHKKEMRFGRKLGHLNAVADSINELQGLTREMANCHEAWVSLFNKENRN